MPKHSEMLSFEQLLKHILRVFPSWGGVNSILWLDHSGSQPSYGGDGGEPGNEAIQEVLANL